MVFENISKMLDKVSSIAGLDQAEKDALLSFKRIKSEELDVDGKKYRSWRIVHNDALGPGKGGIRYHPDVSEDEVKSLAFWMSMKNSLAGLPYGGAKGGIRIDAKNASEEELEKVSRAFVKSFHSVLGENTDIPAPDVYTNPQIMGWMLDEYEKITGRHEPGMITGKPLALQGCSFREDSTSRGGFIVFRELLSILGKKDVTIAVQGFGNAGYNFARIAHEEGLKIVAVSDSRGGIYSPEGLDIPKVRETKEKTGTVTEYSAEKITNSQLLETDADFLVLAALENQITPENAGRIRAKNIIELANGPVTSDADDMLHERGITVVPDVLANAGGVIGSYFEWVQNRTGNAFEPDYLRKRMEGIMKTNFGKVYGLHLEKGISMRTAAYIIAVKRILDAERSRGILKTPGKRK